MERFPITNNGFEKLELELKNLKTVERPSMIILVSFLMT